MAHSLLPLFNFSLEINHFPLFEEDTLQDILASLEELSNGPQNQIADFIDMKFPEKITEICMRYGMKIEGRLGLRILGNLVTGENESTQVLIFFLSFFLFYQ